MDARGCQEKWWLHQIRADGEQTFDDWGRVSFGEFGILVAFGYRLGSCKQNPRQSRTEESGFMRTKIRTAGSVWTEFRPF